MTNNGLAAMLFRVEKFIYSEKATKFCKISTLLLTTVNTVISKVEISQNFVAFSEYMNFTNKLSLTLHAYCISSYSFPL